ncbi:hypothetical protein ADN00_18005 [Ornatilinea apprima]|uniref:Uncharacterized protein n=1 Tax=Ornatilinea apprima TaxID=1134406 RepID=A0A0N8GKV7_9CHLR|nr:hypothetical protein ADN00_18005 [Ornatilinea apprima]
MDWNLARIRPTFKSHAIWIPNDVEIFWQRGGASLLADLLDAIGARVQRETSLPIAVHQPGVPRSPAEVCPGDLEFHHSFTPWSKKPYADRLPLNLEKAWRVDEFLGMQRAKSHCPGVSSTPCKIRMPLSTPFKKNRSYKYHIWSTSSGVKPKKRTAGATVSGGTANDEPIRTWFLASHCRTASG